MTYKIIAIIGEAGTGKDYILSKLARRYKKYLNPIIQTTSRPKRENEIEGKSYYFITKQEFAHKIADNTMLTIAQYRNWYYGTEIKSLDKNKVNIGVFNLQALYQLQSNNNIELTIIKLEVNDKIRLLRQLKREKTPDCKEITRRFQADEKEYRLADKKMWNIFKNHNFLDVINIYKYVKRCAGSWASLINLE